MAWSPADRARQSDLIRDANPGIGWQKAWELAGFALETRDKLIAHYGSVEAALIAPGKPWSDVRAELGISEPQPQEGTQQ